jgi:hypothetical protein
MAPWTFNVMFPYDTQIIFRSLMFGAREDENLKLLTWGPAPRHPRPVYGKAPYYPIVSCTSGGVCSGLNPHARPYYLTTMTSQGFPIKTPIFQPSIGTSSSSSLGASPDQDSTEDCPKIGGIISWNPVVEDRRINMAAPVGASSQNSSSRYPTIWRSKVSEAWTPSN